MRKRQAILRDLFPRMPAGMHREVALLSFEKFGPLAWRGQWIKGALTLANDGETFSRAEWKRKEGLGKRYPYTDLQKRFGGKTVVYEVVAVDPYERPLEVLVYIVTKIYANTLPRMMKMGVDGTIKNIEKPDEPIFYALHAAGGRARNRILEAI